MRLPALRKAATGLRRPNYSWITPELAVGAQFLPAQAAVLAGDGIGSVLDLRGEAYPATDALEEHGLHWLHLPVPDGYAPTEHELWNAVGWIEGEFAQERGVLVHCRAGMGRSVLVVCAVLMTWGATPAEAFRRLKERRNIAVLSEPQWAAARRFWESAQAPTGWPGGSL